MLDDLLKRQESGNPIHVAVVGLGAMGKGICWQLARTPGIKISVIGDLKLEAAKEAAKASGKTPLIINNARKLPKTDESTVYITQDMSAILAEENGLKIDVLVEATNSIFHAAEYCIAAMERKAHVVLMNAEVDLTFGFLLQKYAQKNNVICTSDAGDQHGVLARMIEEVKMWNFRIVQAGNIKGFLNRHATATSLKKQAAERNLDPIQCCSYTDGSKLNIEMALLANGANLKTHLKGMEGPACKDITEILDLFDFDSYGEQGVVDYISGLPQPGGGVYVVGYCDDDRQDFYLNYYKVTNKKPYYLFYRPYHLCHLETPRAVALVALYQKAVLTPRFGRLTDVFAYSKTDLMAGDKIDHAFGGDTVYSLIENVEDTISEKKVPAYWLESEEGPKPTLLHDIAKDQPITFNDIKIEDSAFIQRLKEQEAFLSSQ